MVNGKQGCIFKIDKGLIEGFLLSPLFFIIVVDIFDGILRLAVRNGFLKGLGAKDGAWNITNLHFTDDTLLFCEGSRFDTICLKVLLYNFELASGLKVNFAKSSLIGLGVMIKEKLNVLASILNCKYSLFPLNTWSCH